MIDLHLHVLPEIDDGAATMAISGGMLSALRQMGFTSLVSTAHLMEPLTPDYHFQVQAALDRVRPLAAEHGLELGFGYEHMLLPNLPKRLAQGEPSTLAGSKAILVELPFSGWPQFVETTLYELRSAGYRPILAHPERYVQVQDNPELALAVGAQGAILQITWGSFAGVYGRTVERTARDLLDLALERDILVVLATDAHSEGQRLALVPEGLKWIRKHVPDGALVVEWASRVVPAALLANQPLLPFSDWQVRAGAQRHILAAQPAAIDGSGRAGRFLRALGIGSRSGARHG